MRRLSAAFLTATTLSLACRPTAPGTDPADTGMAPDGEAVGSDGSDGSDGTDGSSGSAGYTAPGCEWPTNPDKDRVVPSPDFTEADNGVVPPRFVLEDQCGQMVDLYDFGGQDAHVVFVVYAGWDPVSPMLADVARGEVHSAFPADAPGFADLEGWIDDERVYWVPILLHGDNFGQAPTAEEVQAFDAAFGRAGVPLLRGTSDEEGRIMGFIPEFPGGIYAMPVALVLDDRLQVVKRPQDFYADALSTLHTLLR